MDISNDTLVLQMLQRCYRNKNFIAASTFHTELKLKLPFYVLPELVVFGDCTGARVENDTAHDGQNLYAHGRALHMPASTHACDYLG